MQYILIEIEGQGVAYQEVNEGQVIRYLDQDGIELFKLVPSGHGSWAVDPNPPRLAWMT